MCSRENVLSIRSCCEICFEIFIKVLLENYRLSVLLTHAHFKILRRQSAHALGFTIRGRLVGLLPLAKMHCIRLLVCVDEK